MAARFMITQFAWQGRRFLLNRAIVCEADVVGPLYVYKCEYLGLHSYAKSQDDALADFHEEFSELWDSIALEDDNKLTPDAAELKKRLLGLIVTIKAA